MKGWEVVGRSTGPLATAVALLWLALGLVWLGWPVWDSAGVPGRAQQQAEAPWVLTAQCVGLAVLALCLWRGAGRRFEPLAAVTALVVGDCVLRAVFSPGAGVEVVHALPLLAGAGLGLAPGLLTGATAALASTLVASTPAETLPAQVLVWALVGAAGALLRVLPVLAAWLAALPLALVLGMLSGVLLNLIGWAQEPGTGPSHFAPGLPPDEVVRRLWTYTRETSIALDLVRGATTALLVLLGGLPLLRLLRGPELRATDRPPADPALASALSRRERDLDPTHFWTPTVSVPPTPSQEDA